MVPTDELREALRDAIDEVIPAGGSDADTRFTDAQIDALLTSAATLEGAASAGWTRKAMRAFSERGGVQESQVGSERFKFVSLADYRDHCLLMAKTWAAQVPGQGSALLLGIAEPDVLGPTAPVRTDLSRLVGWVEV